MQIDHITKGFGKWMLNFPEALKWITIATLWLECWVPFLVFIPIYTGRIRTIIIITFAAFHVGIFLCMDVGLFPWVSIVAWFLFLPGSMWDWLGKRLPRLAASPATLLNTAHAALPVGYARTINLLVAVLILYGAIFNLQVLSPRHFRWFTPTWKAPGYALRFPQRLDLFAPAPNTYDGWLIAVATLEDGSQVDLLNEGRPVNWDKPAMLSNKYRNTHYRMFMANIKRPTQLAANSHPFFVDYLKRVWYEQHGNQRRIREIELYMVVEITKPYPEVPTQVPKLLYRD